MSWESRGSARESIPVLCRRIVCRGYEVPPPGAWSDRDRDFRLFFAGQSISLLGSGMVEVALAFAVLDLTGSVADLAYVLGAQAAAQVAFLLVGGVLGDRWSRRNVMVGSDLVSCASQATTAALLIAGTAHVWELVALQVVGGGSAAFFQPAAAGVIPEIVSKAHLVQQANALRSFSSSVGAIAGPAIAGLLVATVGSGWALGVDAATFAVSAGFLSRLRLAGRDQWKQRNVVRDLVVGWKEYWARSWLVLLNVNATLINMFVMAPLFVLGPAVAKDSLGGAGAWALIMTSFGVGSLLGSVIGLRLHVRHRLSVGLGLGVLWAPLLGMIALQFPASTIAPIALVAGTVGPIRFIANQTTGHEEFPPDLRSRLASFGSLGSIAFAPLGYALTGLLASDLLGITGTLWLGVAIALVASIAIATAPSVLSITARTAAAQEL